MSERIEGIVKEKVSRLTSGLFYSPLADSRSIHATEIRDAIREAVRPLWDYHLLACPYVPNEIPCINPIHEFAKMFEEESRREPEKREITVVEKCWSCGCTEREVPPMKPFTGSDSLYTYACGKPDCWRPR